MNTGRFITTALAATILAIPAAAEAPGYFKIPGTDSTLKIYGKAETWAFYNMDTPKSYTEDQSFNEKGTTSSFTVGRLGVTTTTPSEYGDVNVKVELQAKSTGSSNAGSLNMRHAYGEFGGLLIGQTNSLWVAWQYCPAYQDTWLEDFWGSTYRTRQIRYTFTPTKEIQVAFSMEQDLSGGGTTKPAPTVIGAFQYSAGWGNVVGVVSYQKKQDTTQVGTTLESTTGSGVSFNVGGSWNITENDTVGVRYINGGGQHGNTNDGFYQKTGATDYSFYKSTSWDLGYSHTWNDKFTTNLGVGQVIWSDDKDVPAGSFALDHSEKVTATEFFINTAWKVTKNATFTVEYYDSTIKHDTANTVSTIDAANSKDKTHTNDINFMFSYQFF